MIIGTSRKKERGEERERREAGSQRPRGRGTTI